MAMVYMSNPTNVQMPATRELPEGSVVSLQPGWNETGNFPGLDENPYVKGMITNKPEAQQRRDQALAELDTKVAAGDVTPNDAAKQRQEIAKEQTDELAKASEEWGKRKQEAVDKNVAFTEPHPDPLVQHSIALTAPPGVFATAGMVGKTGEHAPQRERDTDHSERVRPEGQRQRPHQPSA